MVIFGDEAEYYRDKEIERIREKARRAQLQQIESLSPWLSGDELDLLRDVAQTKDPPPAPTTSFGDWVVGFMFVVLGAIALGTVLANR